MVLKDEVAASKALEDECGGPNRAFALMRLYETCRQSAASAVRGWLYGPRPKTAAERLRVAATREGYSKRAVAIFLGIQD